MQSKCRSGRSIRLPGGFGRCYDIAVDCGVGQWRINKAIVFAHDRGVEGIIYIEK